MLWKALGEGAFKWPPISDGDMKLSPTQLSALLEELDWTRVYRGGAVMREVLMRLL